MGGQWCFAEAFVHVVASAESIKSSFLLVSVWPSEETETTW